MSKRKTELTLICGINGTGKTTWLGNNIVDKSKKAIIVTPDCFEWKRYPDLDLKEIRSFSGVRRVVYKSPEELDYLCKCYSGGDLILDDAMAYLTFQTPECLQWIYTRHRQNGVDIYIVAHGLRQFPPRVFTFAQWLVLFNSVENFNSRKKDIREDIFNRIIQAQKRISEKVLAGNPYYHEIMLFDDQIKGKWTTTKK